MLDVLFVLCIIWFVFLIVLAWFNAFNWLVEDRVFPKEVSVWKYIRLFITTPIVISMIVVEGVVNKTLNFFCKEK